ncbi:hypothetical protein NX059_009918 [Plenodomus lindquistii]|nr:hypothetical protein NX059_009918 [Plenodomus lindquistii]
MDKTNENGRNNPSDPPNLAALIAITLQLVVLTQILRLLAARGYPGVFEIGEDSGSDSSDDEEVGFTLRFGTRGGGGRRGGQGRPSNSDVNLTPATTIPTAPPVTSTTPRDSGDAVGTVVKRLNIPTAFIQDVARCYAHRVRDGWYEWIVPRGHTVGSRNGVVSLRWHYNDEEMEYDDDDEAVWPTLVPAQPGFEEFGRGMGGRRVYRSSPRGFQQRYVEPWGTERQDRWNSVGEGSMGRERGGGGDEGETVAGSDKGGEHEEDVWEGGEDLDDWDEETLIGDEQDRDDGDNAGEVDDLVWRHGRIITFVRFEDVGPLVPEQEEHPAQGGQHVEEPSSRSKRQAGSRDASVEDTGDETAQDEYPSRPPRFNPIHPSLRGGHSSPLPSPPRPRSSPSPSPPRPPIIPIPVPHRRSRRERCAPLLPDFPPCTCELCAHQAKIRSHRVRLHTLGFDEINDDNTKVRISRGEVRFFVHVEGSEELDSGEEEQAELVRAGLERDRLERARRAGAQKNEESLAGANKVTKEGVKQEVRECEEEAAPTGAASSSGSGQQTSREVFDRTMEPGRNYSRYELPAWLAMELFERRWYAGGPKKEEY